MSETYATGSEGERLLSVWLVAQGRDVKKSDKKTFDLIVDGRYAEVKSSRAPYRKLGFIALTKAQYQALQKGVEFSLFIVCNTADPSSLEVKEIPSAALLAQIPIEEPTYYWYRKHLDKCIADGTPNTR